MPGPISSDTIDHAGNVYETVASKAASAQSLIAASWSRSLRKHHLVPDGVAPAIRLDKKTLRERRDGISRILTASEPVMDRLFSTLSLAGCSVVLCDWTGVILDQRSSVGDQDDFDKADLSIGADWSEHSQGTNGIGTCIVEGRPVVVHQDQHFRTSNISMTCIGAPIYGSQGDFSAVLDVSACRRDLDTALSALIAQTVRDAAFQIEANHFADAFSSARIVRAQGDSSKGPALLALDRDDVVIGATRAARKIYELPKAAGFTPVPATDLLGDYAQRGGGLDDAERRTIKRAIARNNSNMTAVARDLGMSRATLYRRATKLGISR